MKHLLLTLSVLVSSFCLPGQTSPTQFALSGSPGWIENKGQITDYAQRTRPDILYSYNADGVSFFLTQDGIIQDFHKNQEHRLVDESTGKVRNDPFASTWIQEVQSIPIRFLNTNEDVIITADHPLRDFLNFYKSPTQRFLQVLRFQRVVYHDLWDNIDMIWTLTEEGEMKYEFLVRPGADPDDIQLQYQGYEKLTLDDAGFLVCENAIGWLKEQPPVSFVGNKEVNSRYRLHDNILSFDLPEISPTDTLLIDPTRTWGTYYGEDKNDYGLSIATDIEGNVYITGGVRSGGMASSNAENTNFSGGTFDSFVAKFDSSGNRIWATYLGGTAEDVGKDIEIVNDKAIIGGFTSSSDFPVANAYQGSKAQSNDTFISSLNTSDGFIDWSTFFGGNGNEDGLTLAAYSGGILLAGYSASTDLPTTSSVIQSSKIAAKDGFIAHFNLSGNTLNWCTYLGGSDDDDIYSLVIEATGSILIAGETQSPNLDQAAGASWTPSYSGGSDGFIARISSDGQTILWGTFIGGNGFEHIHNIGIDDGGNFFFGGSSESSGLQTIGANKSGDRDGLLGKYDVNGNLQWLRYFGGTQKDDLEGLVVSPEGDLYVGGYTLSNSNIALHHNSYDSTYAGGIDSWLARFDQNGSQLWGSYIGGAGQEENRFVTRNINGDILAIGRTSSFSGIAAGTTPFQGTKNSATGEPTDMYLVNYRELPDLQISVSNIPDSLFTSTPTDSLSIKVFFENSGFTDVGTTYFNVYLSTSASVNNVFDTVFSSSGYPLPQLSQDSLNVDLVITDIQNAGDYFLIFEIDPDDTSLEVFEENNLFVQGIYIPSFAPDLIISTGVIPDTLTLVDLADTVFLDVTVANTGFKEATNVSYEIYLSDTPELSVVLDTLLSSPPFTLAGGSDVILSVGLVVTSLEGDGDFYLSFIVDPNSGIDEISEDNNLFQKSFYIPEIPPSSLGTVQLSGETITANITNPTSLTSATIFTKPMASGEWNSQNGIPLVDVVNGKLTYNADIPSGDEQGLKVYLSVATGSAVSTSDTLYLYREAQSNITISGGRKEEDYRMISVPLEVSNTSLESILSSSLGEQNIRQWRSFQFVNGQLDENPKLLEPGKAYWIISKQDATIDFGTGSTVEVTTVDPFTWNLQSGWNQVGNPYRFAIAWSDILKHNGNPLIQVPVIFETGTGFRQDSVIRANEGAYIYVTSSVQLEVPLYKNPAAQRKLASPYLSQPLDRSHWEVTLSLSQGDRTDKITTLGVHPEASDSIDMLDRPLIPAFPGTSSLAFLNQGMALSKDIRAPQKVISWDLELQPVGFGDLRLEWDSWFFGNNAFTLIIQDLASGELFDMRRYQQLKVDRSDDKPRYRVYYGTPEDLNEVLNLNRFVLDPPFPNPLEEILHIPVQVPSAGNVSLRIIRENGQELAHLEKPMVEAGFQTIAWDRPLGEAAGEKILILQAVWSGENGQTQSSSYKILVP